MNKIKSFILSIALLVPGLSLAHGEVVDGAVGDYGWDMMSGHMSGFGMWGWMMWLTCLVWLVVGVLAAVYLWQKIKK